MHRPKLLGATLLVATFAVAGVATAVPAPTSYVDVVLSVDDSFRASALPAGVDVVQTLPGVGAVIARVPQNAVSWLPRTEGVRGISPDRPLTVTGSGSGDSGVLAPAALGKPAGTADAGAGVTVAVVDTGVADTGLLQRSSGRLVSGADTSGERRNAPRDGHGHGTFMAGLIAGGSVGGDQVGIAPAARVVDVKVASADGTTSLKKVLAGLDWVVQNKDTHDISVLSLSLAASRPEEGYGRDPLTDGAEAVRNAGIVVVVSAGNDPTQVGDPGQDPLLMTVGAADTRERKAQTADFSGSAVVAGMPRPDVVAPGVSLLSALPPNSAIAQANPDASAGRGLYRGSGTSQATAVTAGAVSIFLSQNESAAPSPDDVRASFATAARDLAGTADGAGLIRFPNRVVRWSAEASGTDSGTAGDPAPTASSWSASSWSASSWSASSWSASSWSASSWSASSWSASSWSASSWSASSWSSASWSAPRAQ